MKKGRMWWNKYLAVLGKSGSLTIAAAAVRVHRNTVLQTRKRHARFNRRCEEQLALYEQRVARGDIVSGRKPGRPPMLLPDTTKRIFLDLVEHSGSMLWAGTLLGFDPGTVRKWRRRDATFDADCLKAKANGHDMAVIAGPWRLRLRDFYRLQARHAGDWERAAHESGISERVAMVIAANMTLQQRQDFTPRAKLHDRRGEVIVPSKAPDTRGLQPASDQRIQSTLSIAEVDAQFQAKSDRAKAVATPEMRVIASWLDERPGATMSQAADANGHSMEQINGWARANFWFLDYMDHEWW